MGHCMSRNSETNRTDGNYRLPPTPPSQRRRTDASPQARVQSRNASLNIPETETPLADGRDRSHNRRRGLPTAIEDNHRLPPPSPARLRPPEIQERVMRRLAEMAAERDRLRELRREDPPPPPPAEDEDDRSDDAINEDIASVLRSLRRKVTSPANPSVSLPIIMI